MALGIGYGLPFLPHFGSGADPYKPLWNEALEGAKAAGATVEDEGGTCLVARGSEEYNAGLPATPSLLIVPQFYKAGNLYQDVPPFVAEDSTMKFAVTRATTATRVNSSGNIESVASGVPRIDWLGQSCPALLVEPSAQNLAFNSQTWASGSNWTLNDAGTARVTIVTGALAAPDGITTANAISPTSGNVAHYLASNSSTRIAFTSGTIYTQSAFFKAGTGNAGRYVQLTFASSRFTQLGYVNFDLQNGVITASGGTSDTNRNARIENYGNGWYRCSFTATCNANGTAIGVIPVLITASGDTVAPAFAGTVTDVIYGWGAQVETGAIPTSYIPTTTGSASRNADVISASGALVSGLIGATEGTIYAEFVNTFSSSYNDGILIRVFADGNNEVFGRKEAASNRYTFRWRANSQNTTFTSVNVPDGVNKIALAYKSGDTALFLNGTQVGSTSTDVRAFSVNPTTVALGSNGSASQFFNDRIRSAALYTTRLTDAQLAQLTK